MGDYDTVMEYFEQDLAIQSEMMGDRFGLRVGMTYIGMGEVLVAQEGREKEAIKMYQHACVIFSEREVGNAEQEELSKTFLKIGKAYMAIEAWDDAITALFKSMTGIESFEVEIFVNAHQGLTDQLLGQTCLEWYCTDESLIGNPKRSDQLLVHAEGFFVHPSNAIGKVLAPKETTSLAYFSYILTWRRITILLGPWRKPIVCSRNTWKLQRNWGHCIAKHAIKLVQRMRTWRNVASVRSHDTAVGPTVYKHGRKVGYVTRSCVHC